MTFPTRNEIITSIDDKNFLGSGNSHTCYKIPNHEDLVAVANNMLDIGSLSALKLVQTDDAFPDRNVGQDLGTIGDDIRICKRQRGIPASVVSFYKGRLIFVPSVGVSNDFNKENSLNDISIDGVNKHIVSEEFYKQSLALLESLNSISVKAYKECLEDMIEISQSGKTISDPNPQNILIDTENDHLGLIDLSDQDEQYSGENPFHLFAMLAKTGEYWTEKLGLSDYDSSMLIKRENIVFVDVLNKILTALEETPSHLWCLENSPRAYDLVCEGFSLSQTENVLRRITALKDDIHTNDRIALNI